MNAQPDAHGTVVLVMGDRVAVRLDVDSASFTGWASMAIYDEQGYKGELLVMDVFQDHALGWVIVGPRRNAIQAGDRAGCRTP